jgi:type IV pilus assembly protein PilN
VVGALWFVLQQQTAQLDEELTGLKSEIAKEQIEQQKIKDLRSQITQVKGQTVALAGVFDKIKPWSAVLQDVRERIPPGVQIKTIEQKKVTTKSTPTPAASPPPKAKGTNAKATDAIAASPPPPATNLLISGTARSFDDVNYFLLGMQRSPFFKGEETELVKAQLVKNPTKLEVPKTDNRSAAKVKYELPQVVEYTIQTNLSDDQASSNEELLRELDRKGAVGLVTRIRTLKQIQEQGATQP